jgi:activator of HSP90 ATPase
VHPTRRQALAGIATLTAAALSRPSVAQLSRSLPKSFPAAQAASAALQGPASAGLQVPDNKARTAIHYEIEFAAPPARFYQAILDQKQFAAFSGLPATIDPNPGGAFSMFGGQIVGRNIELVPNMRIVQAWRPAHWPAGIYSIVRFEIKPSGTGTTLIFDHIGFPAGEYDSLDVGWHSHYWEPLKKYFAS